MAAPAPERPRLLPILLVNFIGSLGLSIVLPFLVYLVTRFGGNAFVYGLISATYPAFQLIGAPVLGRWSDSIGRRRVLIVSQAGTLLSWIIFCVALYLPVVTLFRLEETPFGLIAITLPLVVLFAARALDGLTGGNVSVANAYMSDITPPERRNENFGKMSISSNLGFVMGPALAGVLGATVLGETLPALAALFVSLVALLLIVFKLPESRPPPARTSGSTEAADAATPTRKPDVGFREVLRVHGVGYMLALYFLIFLGFSFFYTAFPVHACTTLGWPVSQTGIFFAALSLMMVGVQGPVLRAASRRYRDSTLILAGGIALAANFALLVSHDTRAVYAAAALFALGNGLMWPSFLAMLSKLAGDRYQGSVQGFGSSAGSLAGILGLVTGGILYEWIGSKTFAVSATVMVLVCVLSLRLVRMERGASSSGDTDPGSS